MPHPHDAGWYLIFVLVGLILGFAISATKQ